ncbi:MAG: hypothetical protein IPJ86_04330 [Bacteroidetes bacterium]|nr:hypothetical protein [Bacteroidota bacterium]
MNINTHNYESWFIDYFDGNLSAGEVAELFLFLEQHPELNEEFSSFENIALIDFSEEADAYPEKGDLIKSDKPSAENIHEWFIAEVEDQLSPEKLVLLENFLAAHPVYMNERELFRNTKLTEEPSITFEGKESIKKTADLSEASIQEWLIAEMEGELNLQQRSLLLSFLQKHPQYEQDRELYRRTKLPLSTDDHFSGKKFLYKRIPSFGFNSSKALRIAAILLLLIGAAFIFRLAEKNNGNDPQFATIEDTLVKSLPEERNIQPMLSEKNPAEKKDALESKKDSVSLIEKNKNYSTEINKPTFADKNNKPVKEGTLNSENNNYKNNIVQNKIQLPKDRSENGIPAENIFAETIASLSPKPNPAIKIEEPFVFTERRYTPKATVSYENPNEPPSLAAIINPARIGEEMIDLAAKNVNKAAGEELIGTASAPAKLPFGSRLLKFAAKAVGKISKDKVKVRTAFNPITGKLSAYEVETEKRVIQKQF